MRGPSRFVLLVLLLALFDLGEEGVVVSQVVPQPRSRQVVGQRVFDIDRLVEGDVAHGQQEEVGGGQQVVGRPLLPDQVLSEITLTSWEKSRPEKETAMTPGK